MTDPRPLSGLGVLVTRPAAQAERLCALIEAAGGRAIRFPTVEIRPATESEWLRWRLAEPWDLLVFVSRNAVEHAQPLFPGAQLPPEPRLAAVGRATAEALTAAGRPADLVPRGRFDSEALLALPELSDVRGRRVLILRGDGGRALLGETLAARGAEVVYAEVYRRVLPRLPVAGLLERWREEIAVATATSDEVLQNLLKLIGAAGQTRLLATPLVVVSERTKALAQDLGFARVGVAERADDEAILAACCDAVSSGAGRV